MHEIKHNQDVRSFFDQTNLYLNRNLGLLFRKQIINDLLGPVSHKKLLDVGCGDGSLSLHFLAAGNQITLMDVSPNMLALAQQKIPPDLAQSVTLLQQDFLELTGKELYDIVLCIGVLAHVSDVEYALKTISRALAQDGRCVLQFTDLEQAVGKWAYWINLTQRTLQASYRYSINPLRAADLKKIADQSGLQLLSERCYWTMPPGAGKLPLGWVEKILRKLNYSPFFSRLGGEKMWLLVKA